MVKVLLVGYSGHQNFGDDLLLQLAYQHFIDLCEVTIWTNVLGPQADYLESWFPKAVIIRSNNLGLQIFKQYDKVLYFGGGVFFDYTQPYALSKYLRKSLAVFKHYGIARWYGTQFGGIGTGLGPFLSKRAEMINRRRLANFQLLGLRDQFSYDLATAYKLNTRLFYGCDLSFAIGTAFYKPEAQVEPNSILICPRKFPHGKDGDNYHNRLVDWAVNQQMEGKKVTIFGFQAQHDEPILEVYAIKGLKTEIWNPSAMKIEDVFNLFTQHEFVVSARMHGIYVAGLTGRASIGINVHPKVKDATSLFNNSSFLEVDFTIEDLENKIKSLSTINGEALFEEKTAIAKDLYLKAQDWVNNRML